MKKLTFFLVMISYVHTQDIQQSAIEIIKGFNGQPIESDQVTSYLLDIARNGHQLDINTKSDLSKLDLILINR